MASWLMLYSYQPVCNNPPALILATPDLVGASGQMGRGASVPV